MEFQYHSTSNKLFTSRIIKFATIPILILVAIQAAAFVGAQWVTREIIKLPADQIAKVDALLRIVELLLDFKVITPIATIATFVIGRYGLREASRNIGQGLAREGEGDA